jgi:hypothetical protein
MRTPRLAGEGCLGAAGWSFAHMLDARFKIRYHRSELLELCLLLQVLGIYSGAGLRTPINNKSTHQTLM